MAAPSRVVRVFLGVAVVALAAMCGPPAGPSGTDDGTIPLDVPVTGEALQATTTDSQLCCCRVVGTITNRSTVPVHATLKYEAYRTGEQDPAATAVAFLRMLQPGEQRRFSASGFVIPCSTVTRFVRSETNLRGVFIPEDQE